jgi:hypothetical protein
LFSKLNPVPKRSKYKEKHGGDIMYGYGGYGVGGSAVGAGVIAIAILILIALGVIFN